MGRYASTINELNDIFTNVIGNVTKNANFQVSMRIYDYLNSQPEFKGIAADILGKMEISVPDSVYAEDKEAVDKMADTIVVILLEIYNSVRQFMSVADTEVYIKAKSSQLSLKLDL